MKNIITRAVKGTKDIIPSDISKWQKLERLFHEFIGLYGYEEIRTPTFEKTELFSRGVGEETDLVTKEMYTWEDKSGESITLRPELTAPVVRAFLQHSLGKESPITKLYYFSTAFRRERPQKGRQRQFYQFGIEAIGSPYPECDAEVISSAYLFLKHLRLSGLTLKLNSIGSNQTRETYSKELIKYLTPYKNNLSDVSQNRLKSNPLRILDTKIPHEIELLSGAPSITEHLSEEDTAHFNEVLSILDSLSISYSLDNNLVRGLDYYCRTTFEITSSALGGQDSLCGGGRYDGLVELLGGKPTPAIGFAAGVERILIALQDEKFESSEIGTDIYIITMSPKSREIGAVVANQLRQNGFQIRLDFLRRSMKSQLREANKIGAKYVIFFGEEELMKDELTIKKMATGAQNTVKIKSIITYFQNEME